MQAIRAIRSTGIALIVVLAAGCGTGEAGGPDDGGPPPPTPSARWSDPGAWPDGAVPAAGAEVVVAQGRELLLDVSPPPLKSLTIDGTLVVSNEADVDLSADWIMVHGTLQAGSESRRHTRRFTVTLTGDGAADIMGMGDKVLGVMPGGRLELHGESRTGWTRLAATASVGATELQLVGSVPWRAGDRVVVAATDFDPMQAEELDVVEVSGARVRMAQPLRYAHWGELQTIAGTSLDERAEVGLLSRNITIRGDSASLASGIGAHVMVMQGAVARVEGVGFHRVGQKARLARYPMHWHLAGAVDGQYFRGNSVWKSFNRCLTIHGTDNLLVEGNVCHDHIGHGFFLEDGAESGNQLVGNLGLTGRQPASGEAVLPSDTRPATFWITNPANVYRANHAAGSRGFGFWYALPAAPTGLSTGQPDLPRRTPLGEFRDNVAHSNRSGGLNVDDGPRPDGTTETTNYSPRQDPAADTPPVVADFAGFRAWKNLNRAVWLRGSQQRLTGAVLADNAIGATFAASETFVQNSVFIGESANRGAGLPSGTPYRGYEFYDGRVGAENVTFANFTTSASIPSSALGYNRRNAFPIAPTNYARGLTFQNATPVYLENAQADKDGDKAAAFWDENGSVTGIAGAFVLANEPFMLANDCTQQGSWNAWVCTGRRARLGVRNNSTEAVAPLTLTRDDARSLALAGVPDSRTSAWATVIPGRSYAVTWGAGMPPRPRLHFDRGREGETLQVSFPWTNANVNVIRDYNTSRPLPAAASLAELEASTGDRYFLDATAGTIHFKLVIQPGRDWATMFVEPR
jgi:cell migration-inducing and hyaluronan-binding protein